ncbi:hypothetical protein [Kineosporia babensis]|uniref:Uncharacterized protein n=1 Tax=Kineosporia babensis TaxID=499548 RepID=A0A9X1NMU3_9ACTN|nr:hypothetical protein [Kineosporia babensis]MCD5316011.1 hypothetical protein [Kineosporia babensis]
MIHHSMSGTTVTLELTQVQTLNRELRRHAPVTAGRLGLGSVPEKAVLRQVQASGPPSFPYLYGRFDAGGPAVELHTRQLQQLSDLWHLHQRWGVS